jgi:hypothetical protein
MKGLVRLTVNVCKKTTALDDTLAKNSIAVDTSEADAVDEADTGTCYSFRPVTTYITVLTY